LVDNRSVRRPPLWLIFSITATGVMANTVIGPSVPEILEHFDRPDSAAGLLVASGPAPSILLSPVAGLLTDRFGRRRILIPCLVLFGVGGMAAGLAPSFTLLLVGRFVQGMGASGLIWMSLVLIGDFWDGERRARYTGYNSAVLTTCLAIFPGVGGVLTEWFGWRWSFAPYGVALITAVLIYRHLDPAVGDDTVHLREQLIRAIRGVRNRVVLGSCLSMFLLFVAVFGLFLTTLPLLLEDRFGLGPAGRGLVLTAPALSSTVGALTVSRVRRRLGTTSLLSSGFGLFAIGYLVIGLSPVLGLLLVAAMTYGWVEGTVIPTLLDLVNGAAPPDSRGAVISAQVTFVRTGQTVGPLLAGLALTSVSEGALFVFGAVVLGATAIAQVAVPLEPSRPAPDLGPVSPSADGH
jgi:ACDE family multidrug resistance protein